MGERERLQALVARDGMEAAKEWAKRTAVIYGQSISNPDHYASQPAWKPRFEQSIHELRMFAETGVIP
jgi:hypothetical protein